MTFSVILSVTISVFLIIGVGCLCRVVGLVTESSEKTIMALALNVLYPCFIISEVCGNQTLQQVSVVVTALLTGLTLTAIALAVAAAVGKLLKLKPGPEQNTFTVSGAIQNYGFIPIPLLRGLFPDETETVGLLFIHNLGLELALWTVGVVIISGTREGMWRRLVNGPTVAIILGLFLNFSSGHELIPEVAKKAMEQLGLCTIPISLLLVGVSLAGVVIKGNWLSGWRIPVSAIALRFLIMPVFFLLAALLLSNFSRPLMLIMLIESAMPAAAFPIVIAKHFGGKPGVAVQIVIFTTVASLILTPAILTLAIWLFGVTV